MATIDAEGSAANDRDIDGVDSVGGRTKIAASATSMEHGTRRAFLYVRDVDGAGRDAA